MDYIYHKTKRSMGKTIRKDPFQQNMRANVYSRQVILNQLALEVITICRLFFLGTVYCFVIWYNVKKLMVISLPNKRINTSFSFLL